MTINWIRLFAVLWCGAVVTAGCASYLAVPEALEAQLDKEVTFAQILAAPESFVGKRIVVGGEVLKAKRAEAGMQLEVLQLPLNADYEPTLVRTESQGRFLALTQELLDPATIREGTAVTLVGEVTGARMDRLDEVEYRYPTFGVKHLYVWPPGYGAEQRSGVSIGVFGGMGVGSGGRIGGGIGRGY
jgi:outer membrane lipoprotein